MCDNQQSVWIDSDSGQASDRSVNNGNKDVFFVNLVLYNPRTIRFARLGSDALSRNAVNRLANQNRVNCLFHWSANQIEFLRNREKYMRRAQRTVRNEKVKTSFSLGRTAEGVVVCFLSDQLAQPEGTVNAS